MKAKKIIIALVAILSSYSLLAVGELTEKEISCLNNAKSLAGKKISVFFSNKILTNSVLAAKVDSVLFSSTNEVYVFGEEAKEFLPKAYEKSRNAHFSEFPVMYGGLDKGIANCDIHKTLSIDELIEWKLECIALWDSMRIFRLYQSQLSEYIMKKARRGLRGKGVALSSKDGLDYLNKLGERVSAAINAPRFSGLQEILDELGVNATVKTKFYMSKQEADELMEQLYYGDAELGKYNECRLIKAIGVEEYNKFVERYNGGGK